MSSVPVMSLAQSHHTEPKLQQLSKISFISCWKYCQTEKNKQQIIYTTK